MIFFICFLPDFQKTRHLASMHPSLIFVFTSTFLRFADLQQTLSH
jgi:hypothetical protein